jgi:Tfp pilus assembly protein PilZ
MRMTHKTTRFDEPSSRFFKFFRRFFNKKPSQQKQRPFYERNFHRFPMEFRVIVDFVDQKDKAIQDAAELRDISGSGAFFVSAVARQYHVGQSVFLTIYLAGTNDVGARVRVESSVVRLQPMGTSSSRVGEKIGVAVKFNETFAFERIDAKPAGDLT